MIFSKKKLGTIAAVFSTVLLCAAVLFLAFPRISASMNIEESRGRVRIFIGETNRSVGRRYSKERTSFLMETAKKTPDTVYSAVAPLDGYYTEDEIGALVADNGIELERVYLWAPGETGKVSLAVKDNDIARAKRTFATGMTDPENKELTGDLERMKGGEFKIYALTIRGTAEKLAELQSSVREFVMLDLKYNPDAEGYAARQGKSFEYIELPTKPDGAL